MFDPGSGGDPAPTHSERSWPVNEAAALATAAVSIGRGMTVSMR